MKKTLCSQEKQEKEIVDDDYFFLKSMKFGTSKTSNFIEFI